MLRRLRAMALEAFKILNKENPVYLHDIRTTRFGSNSFRSTAAKLWNSLPQRFRDENSFNLFKSLINA